MHPPSVSIELDRLADLFEAPRFAPLEGKVVRRTGLERLADAVEDLGSRNIGDALEVTIRTPPPTADPVTVATAIRVSCDERLARDEWELRMLRRAGRHALWIGVGLLAACLSVATAINAMSFLPEFVRRVLGESFGIAGWVVLWRPLELLVFEPWPIRRDIRIYGALRDASVNVLPAAPQAAGPVLST